MNKQIRTEAGKLYFDTIQVQLDSPVTKLMHRIYVIRVWNEKRKFWQFVGGLDISSDLSKFWFCGFRTEAGAIHPETRTGNFAEIAAILDTLHPDTKGQKWAIFEEEYQTVQAVNGFIDEALKTKYAAIAAEEERQQWEQFAKDMEQYED